jgi:flagellar motor switch protein FliG
VDFEDLGYLDGGDLRAVLDLAGEEQVLDALVGTNAGLRCLILNKLPSASAHALEAQINLHGPVADASAHTAQRAVVEVLCRLSRSGVVAFDDPDDMVA